MQTPMLTLEQLNSATQAEFTALLDGVYEHSPWIAEQTWHARPFSSLAQLKRALIETLRESPQEARLGLIKAHPELAGKAMVTKSLTAESTNEQSKAGLTDCTPEEFERIQKLNADYNAKFGFPFILAVRGPRGLGMNRYEIMGIFSRRLNNPVEYEFDEALRNIHRIAEIRLNDKFATEPTLGNLVWDWHEQLACHSEAGYAERGELCVTYLTDAHRACARELAARMRDECGFDEVTIDAVGNVVGVYHGTDPQAKRLLTGSHYDTVRNGGKYDGRLGILLPLAIVKHLQARGERLPFSLEIVGFAEEEGVRFRSTFLGSSALAGRFDPAQLDQIDTDGVTMRAALQAGGHDPQAIPAIARDPAQLLGYVEVHIEQGPVLLERGLPLGVVTAIAGSSRYLVELAGLAGHAGTTPMELRRDAAAAAAEIVLLVERRCADGAALVGTVGQLAVPDGSVNVVPGRCRLSLDIRAGSDAVRLAAVRDILDGIASICARRRIDVEVTSLVQAAAVPCAPRLMERLGAAVARAGLPRFDLPSGAGHDAMALAGLTEVAMLFTRCGNGGISHNPLETMTADDADIAARVLLDFLRSLCVREAA